MKHIQNERLFQEHQQFRAWWLWCILLLVSAIFAYRLLAQSTPMDGNEKLGLAIAFAVNALVALLFSIMKLETEIRTDGIHVRFYPFQLSFRHYPWHELKGARIRKYSALFEYGGWGLRGFGNDRALNVSGSIGIQLETKRGKRLLIGTRKPDEAAAAIDAHFPNRSAANV